MISLFFFVLAAICNSVMDTLEHHFDNSIFRKLNPFFWNPVYSWCNKYIDRDGHKGHRKIKGTNIDFPDALTDGWHLFKMLMIVFLALSVITFEPYYFIANYWLRSAVYLLIYGTAWNCTFSIFYNKLLIKK